MEKHKPTLYLIMCNHFDLAWRRPFRVNMRDKGLTFVPYAKIEQYYIEDNIALCKKYPEYKFCIESFAVLDEYLKRFPERREEIIRLAKKGKIFIPGAGYAIIDANMVAGETLVRNLVYGTLETEQLLGQKNRQAYRADAFGNSAQMPQIFRGCEMNHAVRLDYVEPDGKFWRGIDGSTVVVGYLPNVGNGGNAAKYPPCPECKGTGKKSGKSCEFCHGRGIDPKEDYYWPFMLDEKKLEENGSGYIYLTPEEYLPKEATIIRARELSKKYNVKFVTPEEPLEELNELFSVMDEKDLDGLNSSPELNPYQTGCYVSRIKSKQVLHKQENELFALETLAAALWLKSGSYPYKKLRDIWHEFFFTAFHDCVTGTVVDAGYKELEVSRAKIDKSITALTEKTAARLTARKDGTVTFFNTTGFSYRGITEVKIPQGEVAVNIESLSGNCACKVLSVRTEDGKNYASVLLESVPPFSAETFKISACRNDLSFGETSDKVIENSRFRITADENGICDIFDKKLNKTVLRKGKYRPGELILEHDEGDPWATLSHDRDRFPLSDKTKLVSVEKNGNIQRMVFTVSPTLRYNQHDISATCYVTLTEGLDRIDFHTDAYWNNYNHRVRVAFPAAFNGAGIYGIPYGMIERKEYEPIYGWAGRDGDYPAENWGGVEGDGISIAVLNRGTPSYKTEAVKDRNETDLFVSILRSPTVPCFLHEPDYYSMTDWDGMRDAGNHSFDYSLCVYDGRFSESSVVADAINYGAAPTALYGTVDVPKLPQVTSDGAAVMSVKCSEDGKALVMRINEYRGKECAAKIVLPAWVDFAEKTNMLERNGEKLSADNGIITLDIRPFEIATVKFYKRKTGEKK